MRDHGNDQAAEAPAKALKSLLKKPGQTKPKGQKHRVVINEKLNESFAADYIILIKEECCPDYEECDCCCQEHEMIRLGNCKECRAELNFHFGSAGSGSGGARFGDRDCEVENEVVSGHELAFGSEESQGEDEGEDQDIREDKGTVLAPLRNEQQQQRQPHQQQETLSPPEGYKDVCEETELPEQMEHQLQPVCAECNYYHQRTAEAEEQANNDGTIGDFDSSQDTITNVDEDVAQETNNQAQQTTPDLHQRYLVETITMTTVTERRIVREINDEEARPNIDEPDNADEKAIEVLKNGTVPGILQSSADSTDESSVHFDEPIKSNGTENIDKVISKSVGGGVGVDQGGRETPDATELSLTFKLGNVSLVTNSLKPNSAVRQLFPDPRFISPPPASAKTVPPVVMDDVQEDDGNLEAQKFLITTESLRLFDAVKRSKLTGAQSDSDNESSVIKKTIERNALRRSLICKYESSSKKKNLRSKDLTLEERIRQLTCVDLDDQDTESSTSENATTCDGSDIAEFPVRTSPSGEEAKIEVTTTRNPGTVPISQDYNNPIATAPATGNMHQSTYRKITDLFAQKKSDSIVDTTKNLPDLGIGNKLTQGKEYPAKTPVTKMNSDVRKQFLASLAPLSCVTATNVDSGREDYYQLSSKISANSNRDSISCNSDSSYSLEDIEAVLRGEEKNYKNAAGPPDVTRGTPTGIGPDGDSSADELLAFVEQDRSRTERIKKRYNDTEDHDDDDDDELNDYGFNRRPSVRGIKPQFGSTNEIIRQLQSRNAASNTFPEVKPGSHMSWSYYDNEAEKQRPYAEEEDEPYQLISDGRGDTNTINRINTMQKQINDIYQTIAETAVSVQGSLKRGSYLESTLQRPSIRVPTGDECHRYADHKNGLRFPEQHAAGVRMLRIAGGGDGAPGGNYNTLPAKARRNPAVAISNYHCGVVPAATSPDTKCYRTMYFVPYNGITDPTYQNIQRILPPHASPNYASHIERYPYPRNGRADQQPRYYVRPTGPPPHSQSALHLHLHQPDEFRVPNTLPLRGMHPLQLHQQHQQAAAPAYGVQQSIPYPGSTPIRGAAGTNGGGYSYQVHLGRGAADMQTQTAPPPLVTTSQSVPTFNNVAQLGTALSTSASAALASPTKLQQQRANSCTAAERGVPEGAASAPSHDFSSNNTSTTHSSNSFLGHTSNVPTSNTQNSVYYAMNV